MFLGIALVKKSIYYCKITVYDFYVYEGGGFRGHYLHMKPGAQNEGMGVR